MPSATRSHLTGEGNPSTKVEPERPHIDVIRHASIEPEYRADVGVTRQVARPSGEVCEVGVPVVRIAAGDGEIRPVGERIREGVAIVVRAGRDVPRITGARLRDRPNLESPRHLIGHVADELVRPVVVGKTPVRVEVVHVLGGELEAFDIAFVL